MFHYYLLDPLSDSSVVEPYLKAPIQETGF